MTKLLFVVRQIMKVDIERNTHNNNFFSYTSYILDFKA